ncbi:MAG: 2-oxoglutarate dehydrogenase complex dihydrolipoyllysine-residue succinyltransferase [Planctomycetes bacterium]|nr:2-oxoglutarate dehydrogenase complex dihydrolipoyllysine-residue succinyltransferase [Planctomycetota bacterium]
MPVELRVPAVGESITEVQIGEWLKSPGESARIDEALVVIETDKVTVELPAPVAGRVVQVLKAKGSTAKVGEVIGYLEAGAPEPTPTAAPAVLPAAKAQVAPPQRGSAPAATPASHVMPAAARAMALGGVDPSRVVPTGPGGRTLVEDVRRASPAAAPVAPAAPASGSAPLATDSATAPTAGGPREEDVVPMTPLRKRIAQRLVEAQSTAAILTTFNEIDMSAVSALRKVHQERFLERHGIKLGFMAFFVKAVIEALKRVPTVNAEVRGDAVAYRNYFDIGIAVGGGKGLVVPIVRDADRLSFAGVEQKIAELGARARDNKLTLEELTGGTFTISNGGIYGSLLSTPILNPPQSGILGLHAIQDRAVVVAGQIVVRPMMYVALSYDHRIIDGREAVTFLKIVKENVEDPARMLLEI